jgi:serine/threonine-protein kinase PRP4
LEVPDGTKILDETYKTVKQIGVGSHATVYEAVEVATEKPVAIKVLRSQEIFRSTGEKEAKTLTAMEGSSSVIKLLGQLEHKGSTQVHLCLVSELFPSDLRRTGRVALSRVPGFARQLCAAVAHVNARGYVHLDIKPDNLFITDDDRLVLGDFGAAETLETLETAQSAEAGTELVDTLVPLFYRSPEVMLGARVDATVDVWSIGCCVYEMATGKILFEGETNRDILEKQMNIIGMMPPSLRSARLGRHYFEAGSYRATTGLLPVVRFNKPKPLLDLIAPHIDEGKPKGDKEAKVNALASLLGWGASTTERSAETKKALEGAAAFLTKCLTLEPKNRWGAAEAADCPWLQPPK